jgi:hypothetical protein
MPEGPVPATSPRLSRPGWRAECFRSRGAVADTFRLVAASDDETRRLETARFVEDLKKVARALK